MPDYKKMYFTLFNAMHQADTIIRDALREASTIYMEEDPTPDAKQISNYPSPKDHQDQ